MKSRLLTYWAVAMALVMTSTPMFGHHGNSDYDLTNPITLHATVTEFQFVNPHSLLSFTVKNDQGKLEEWEGELTSPSMLSRRGWTKDTVKPGDQITVVGNRVKNGSNNMLVRMVILMNGQEFPAYS